MGAGFRLIRGAEDLPGYGIEQSRRHPATANLERRIASILAGRAADEMPGAFVWNDIVPVFRRGLRWDYMRLIWPLDDPLLAGQVDVSGRCAVRADLLEAFHEAGVIARPDDTSGALDHLIARQDAPVVELDDVFRFVGSQRGAVYRPLEAPRPDRHAERISVIVNYRDRADLMEPCLTSLARQRMTAGLELFLVDNQSSADSRRAVESMAARLPARFSVRHLDYDAAFNHSAQTALAAAEASGDVLFMLNNDTRLLDGDVLQTLSDWAMMPGVASAGPRVVGRRGRLVSAGVQACPQTGDRPPIIRESEIEALSRTIRFSAGASFACAAVRRPVWNEIGGCDAVTFPTQYNDADFDLRTLAAGYRHVLVGTVAARHEPGSSGRSTADMLKPLQDRLRARHPDIGAYRRLDPAIEKPAARPAFDDPVAGAALFLNRFWQRVVWPKLRQGKSRRSEKQEFPPPRAW